MDPEEQRRIGARITRARRESGLTQRELADRLGISTRSVQNYESGAIVPWRHLARIEVLTRKRSGWLLSGDEGGELMTTVHELLETMESHNTLLREHLRVLQLHTARLREHNAARPRPRRMPRDT